MEKIPFNSGNPSLLFQSAAAVALRPSDKDLGEYPIDPIGLPAQKFGDMKVLSFLEREGLRAPWQTNNPQLSLAFAHGVTNAFDLTVGVLVAQTNRLNEVRIERSQHALKPVMLAPVPTYGIFFDNLRMHGVEIVTVGRDVKNGWRLSAEKVASKLEELRNDDSRLVIGYYDSNPQNPCGLVRDKEETAVLAEIFGEHNNAMQERDNKLGAKGTTHRMSILDDLIYYGLHYDKRPASFLTEKRTTNDTIAYLGISKYGLPGLRGAMVIAPSKMRNRIAKRFWLTQNHPSAPSLIAVATAFSGIDIHARNLQDHLSSLNKTHKYGYALMSSLVRGVEERYLDTPEGRRIINDVAAVTQSPDQAIAYLTQGIPGLKISTPEAGFLAILDASSYLGTSLQDAASKGIKHKGKLSITDMDGLDKLFNAAGASCLRGDICGLDKRQLAMRVSVSLPPTTIVRGMLVIRNALATLTSPHL